MTTRAKAAGVRPCTTPECLRMKELFSLWHDHGLQARTRRGLEAHLAACPPCRVYFESLEVTIGLVREWPGVEVPGQVRGHLRELLLAKHERSGRGGCGCPGAAGKRAAGRAGAARPAAKRAAAKKPVATKPVATKSAARKTARRA